MTLDEELTEAVQLIDKLYHHAIYTASLDTLLQAKAFLDKHQRRMEAHDAESR